LGRDFFLVFSFRTLKNRAKGSTHRGRFFAVVESSQMTFSYLKAIGFIMKILTARL